MSAGQGGVLPPIWSSGYQPGEDLHSYLAEDGPLGPDLLRALADSLLGTLAGVHSRGITHRYLKPANILITSSGPRIIGFVDGGVLGGTSPTPTGFDLGSPIWSSPEQLVGEAGPASDVFSLGLVLAYAATAHHPYNPHGNRSQRAIEDAIRNDAPDLTGVDPATAGLLTRMLDRDPATRLTAATAGRVLVHGTARGAIFATAWAADSRGWSTTARQWYERAADRGSSTAMFNLGVLAAEDGDRDTARDWYEQAADRGSSAAMFNLGVLAAEDGDGASAQRWYEWAAELGVSTDMFRLGVLAAADGDRIAARRWYEQAADHGDGDAMYRLGELDAEDGDRMTARVSYE